mmetsp:Transcript_25379/g.59027  ORF Transcript_25379/g.59027 Transcript_25379/m.59027 type:complete len:300 (+) Transcript_25379:384-1283(+)
MLLAHGLLIQLALPLGFLLLQLNFNDALKLIALILSLLTKAPLLLRLLLLPSLIELLVDRLQASFLSALLVTCSAFIGLHGTLSSESIHLSCLVLGLLLHGAEAGHLLLLLSGNAHLLVLNFTFPLLLRFLVLNDFLLLKLLCKHLLFLDLHCCRVGLVHLLHQSIGSQLLLLLLLNLLLPQGFDLFQYKGSLLITRFFLAHSGSLSVLDLVNDHCCPATLIIKTALLTLFIHLQSLEPLDFHHCIKLAFLLLLFRLHLPLLLDLRIAYRDHLGVQHHLVHVLDVIHVLIDHLLCALHN